MKPITVLFLLDDLSEWTGTEVHLMRLLRGLDRKQVRPVMAVVGRSDLAPEFQRHGVQVVSLNIVHTLAPAGLVGVGRVAALIRRERARLVVTYHTTADLLGPPAARLTGVPVISCRRDEGFTKKPIHIALQRPFNRLLRGMISVSHSVVRAVERAEGYPARLHQVIWNGEDLARFSPGHSSVSRELGIDDNTPVVTSVSLISPVKDHATQLSAFARLLPRYPRALLLVAGDGPLMDDTRRRAASLGDRVRFLGHRKDVADLLRASDIFLQTSLSEGFSNAILQAMACALPVVVTRVGGNPELVTPDCGTLVDTESPDEVTDALDRLLAVPDLRRAFGEAGRARAERYCSLQVMVDIYTDAFYRAVRGDFPGPSSGR